MKFEFRPPKNLWYRILSIFIAVLLWIIVINIENPEDNLTVRNIKISIINAENLEANNLIIYSMEQSSVDVRFSGNRLAIGKLKDMKDEIKAVIDMSDYTYYGRVADEERYVPINVLIPENIRGNIKLDYQSIDNMRVGIGEKVTKTFDVTYEIKNNLSSEYILLEDRIKLLPNRVDVTGAGRLIDKIKEVRLEFEVNEPVDSYEANVYAVDGNDNIVGEVSFNTPTVKVQLPIFVKKTININLSFVNELMDEFELDEIKIEPQQLIIGVNPLNYNDIENVLTIPIEINNEVGEYTVYENINLADGLVNINNVSEIKITYRVR